jgi:hypothetical protein
MQGYGSDLRQIALKLAAEPKRCGTRARVVVFTQGADSTIVASNGTVTEYPVDKLAPELLVDTNGEQNRGGERSRRRNEGKDSIGLNQRTPITTSAASRLWCPPSSASAVGPPCLTSVCLSLSCGVCPLCRCG